MVGATAGKVSWEQALWGIMYAEYRSLGFFPRGYKESVFKQINTLNLHFGNITPKAV